MSKETWLRKAKRGAHRTYIPGDPALGAQLDQALKRMGLRNFPNEGRGIVRGRNITEVNGVDPVKAKSQPKLSFNANLKAVMAEI